MQLACEEGNTHGSQQKHETSCGSIVEKYYASVGPTEFEVCQIKKTILKGYERGRKFRSS